MGLEKERSSYIQGRLIFGSIRYIYVHIINNDKRSFKDTKILKCKI